MNDATVDKATMRKQMLRARRALTTTQINESSARISEAVQVLPEWQAASLVLTYIPLGNGEVDSWPLIRTAWSSNKQTFAPRVTQPGTMEWAPFTDEQSLKRGPYGILEPATESRREPWPPDAVVLVPGVAFTAQGNRLGQGGGYFDRFLATFPGTSIGLAHKCQCVGSLPTDDWDIPVDIVVSP